MDFKIIWSDAAIADLQEVCSYVAQHDPQAALGSGGASSATFGFWLPSPLSAPPTPAA